MFRRFTRCLGPEQLVNATVVLTTMAQDQSLQLMGDATASDIDQGRDRNPFSQGIDDPDAGDGINPGNGDNLDGFKSSSNSPSGSDSKCDDSDDSNDPNNGPTGGSNVNGSIVFRFWVQFVFPQTNPN